MLDTSVFIARERRGLSLEALPDELAVSVVTCAELTAGVLAAPDVGTRPRRLATLAFVSGINPVGSTSPRDSGGRNSARTWRPPVVG